MHLKGVASPFMSEISGCFVDALTMTVVAASCIQTTWAAMHRARSYI